MKIKLNKFYLCKYIISLLVFIVIATALSGCDSASDSTVSDTSTSAKLEQSAQASPLLSKHQAKDASDLFSMWSSEVIDTYSNQTLFLNSMRILDVAYIDGARYAFMKSWFEDGIFQLNISDEIYDLLKDTNDGDNLQFLAIVFTIEEVTPMQPHLTGDIDISLSSTDSDIDIDDESLGFESSNRIIKGTLLDLNKEF